MENSGINSTATNEVASISPALDPTAQPLYYQPTYSNTTNDYGTGNVYERTQGSQNFMEDSLAAFNLPQYGEPVNTASTVTNLQTHAPHPNYWNFPNYNVASLPVPQAPNVIFTPSDQDRGGGSLPLASPRSLDQYLTTPQSHLLQLRGTNPPNQPPALTNNFHAYAMPDRPQRFSTFNALPYSADPALSRSVEGHGLEEESSHINRKKRKACGRCGPCQRKDNCGACMNCVNRAKGKQICIYRKCEELKKKPGTESYAATATPDHQIEPAVTVRREKRKDLEQTFSDLKRSRTEDPIETRSQQEIAPHQKFTSAYTSNSQNFSPQQHSGITRTVPLAQPYSTSLPGNSGTFQQQLQQSNPSQHTGGSPFPDTQASTVYQSIETVESSHTTDIISEALREIENNSSGSNELPATLNQGVASLDNAQREQTFQRWNQSLQSTSVPLPRPSNQSCQQSQLQLQGSVRLPGQPPPLPPGSETTQKANQFELQSNVDSQTFPKQALGDLTAYNEFGPFQRATFTQSQLNSDRQLSGVHCAYYENIPANAAQSQAFSPRVSDSVIQVQSPATTLNLVSLNNQQRTVSNDLISTSTPGSMYHGDNSLAYGSPYSQDSGMQYVVSQSTNALPAPSARLNQPHGSTMQPGPLLYYQDANPQSRFSNVLLNSTAQQGNCLQRSLVHSPAEFAHKPSDKQPTQAKQSSSIPTMLGNTTFVPNSVQTMGHGFYSSQFSTQKWDNVPSNPLPMGAQSNIPVPPNVSKESENMSSEAAHDALLSPASMFPKEINSHNQMISQMPELAPSPEGSVNSISENPEAVTQISSQVVKTCQNQNAFILPAQGQFPKRNFSGQRFLYDSLPAGASPDTAMGQASNPNQCGMLVQNASGSQFAGTVRYQHSTCISDVTSTSSQSTILAPISRQVEGFSSTVPVIPTTSQSDTNLTISPGESGYDSAEIVHVIEDSTAQKASSDGSLENHPSEVKNGLAPENSNFESSGIINENVPKNLYRASVDSKAGSAHNTNLVVASRSISRIETDLPSAGACDSKNSEQFNINATPLENAQDSVSKRSLSYDSAAHSEERELNPVRLRRYSNQETSTIPSVSPRLSASCGDKYLGTTLSTHVNKTSSLPTGDHQCPFDGMPKQYAFQSATQRRKVPFETPPVTPRSAITRQPSNDTASDSGAGTPKIADILPTPPHAVETPFMKTGCENITSHRGFKVQTSDNSPMKTEFVPCNCIEDGKSEEAPYYTHLGAAESVQGIRRLFEKRTGYSGNAIRIEKVIYTGKEGKTSKGCPMAKWIIRRSGEEEKVLIVCRRRPGHRCSTAIIVVIILLWDGVARPLADFSYNSIINCVPKHGEPTERRCATNDERTCACQGFDESTCGASFSFGCSWSMYYNGCKYARSTNPNKYKLSGTKDPDAEKFVGKLCERLATVMSPLYEMAAPDAFFNQVEFETKGSECRLGEFIKDNSRPFSGVTSCLDFCAHSHKDQHNVDNGSTVVVTFTKPELRTIGGRHSDEQLHVLPLCKLDISNEQGNFQGVAEKISSGAIEILRCYRHESRQRNKPKLSKKQKMRAKKKVLDSTDSPTCKRRGRPPKRSRSSENLQENGELKVWNDDGAKMYQQKSYQTPPRLQRFASPLSGHQPPQMQPPFSGPLSPTRWPYRKHVPPYCFESNILAAKFSNQNVGNQRPPAPNSASLLDNLPSIGNFFYQNSPGTDSQVGLAEQQQARINSPLHHDNTKSAQPVHPFSPFPPTTDASMHTAQQNFTCEPRPQKVPDQTHVLQSDSAPGTPQNSASISLKEYAAQNTPNFVSGPGLSSHPRFVSGDDDEFSPQVTPTCYNPEETAVYSDSEENFLDSEIGGVAVAPGHGSVLIECAKKELHATTAVKRPNRFYPSRISLVFYQHKSMNARNHGAAEYEAKEEERRKQKEEKKQEEMQIKEQDNSFVPGMAPQFLPAGAEMKSQEQILPGQYRPTATAPLAQLWNPGLACDSDRAVAPKIEEQGIHPIGHEPPIHFQTQSFPCLSTQSMREQMGNVANLNMSSSAVRTPYIQQTHVQGIAPQPVQSSGWLQSIFQPYKRFSTPSIHNLGQIYSHPNDAQSRRYISPLSHMQRHPLQSPSPIQRVGSVASSIPGVHSSFSHANYIRPTSPHVSPMQIQQNSPLPTVYAPQMGQHVSRFPPYPTEHFTVRPRPQAEIYGTSSTPRHAVTYPPGTYHDQQFQIRYMNSRM